MGLPSHSRRRPACERSRLHPRTRPGPDALRATTRLSRRGRAVLPTRPFRTGVDEAAWLVANNREFAGHPEQGQWDLPTLLEREHEPWFDAEGFRVLEVDGRIAGSCWTKIHRDADPPLGEIYVIGVDPDFQGRGFGRGLTLAGLDWLSGKGLTVGMLYVDGANAAARALYGTMDFRDDHVDRAYLGRFGPSVTAVETAERSGRV